MNESSVIHDKELIDIVKKIITSSADELLTESFTIKEKGKQDIVTNLDFEMERRIKKELLYYFPEDGFIGEEENHDLGNLNTKNKMRTWILDPIDGTLNFTQGHPFFGVQIALMIGTEPYFSMIYLPKINELYYAISGKGAFINDQSIHVVKETKGQQLKDVIVTFGDFSKSNPSSRSYQLKAIEALVEKAMRVRIQGASSVDFAFTSVGKNGCHIIFSKNIWELAPGLMLAKESGCVTCKISGEKHGFSGEGIIIAQNLSILSEVSILLEDIK